jgi:hypothetical protein
MFPANEPHANGPSASESSASESSAGGPPVEELVCPVCRAKQTPQVTCRRCSADLSLLVQARRSQQLALAQAERAWAVGDSAKAQQLEAYLRWLKPSS